MIRGPGLVPAAIMGEFGIWSWSARTVDHVANPVRQFFSQGDHTIEISGRSFGHAIDRIALYRYEDVNFDSGLNGTLALSQFARQDGSIVDPNPINIPPPNSTQDSTTNTTIETGSEQDPEPAPTPENELADTSNVEIAPNSNSESIGTICVANTLTLPTSDATSLISADTGSLYNRNELSLEADASRVLLSFDLSLLPAFNSAELRYTTGAKISNGSLEIFLGSHSDWIDSNAEAEPDATVKIADARGGWDSDTYYRTEIDASLLPQDETTLVLAVSSGSDQLQIGSVGAEQPLPILAISGDDNFCAELQANAEQNSSQSSTENESVNTIRRSGGSLSYWFVTLLLIGNLRRMSK